MKKALVISLLIIAYLLKLSAASVKQEGPDALDHTNEYHNNEFNNLADKFTDLVYRNKNNVSLDKVFIDIGVTDFDTQNKLLDNYLYDHSGVTQRNIPTNIQGKTFEKSKIIFDSKFDAVLSLAEKRSGYSPSKEVEFYKIFRKLNIDILNSDDWNAIKTHLHKTLDASGNYKVGLSQLIMKHNHYLVNEEYSEDLFREYIEVGGRDYLTLITTYFDWADDIIIPDDLTDIIMKEAYSSKSKSHPMLKDFSIMCFIAEIPMATDITSDWEITKVSSKIKKLNPEAPKYLKEYEDLNKEKKFFKEVKKNKLKITAFNFTNAYEWFKKNSKDKNPKCPEGETLESKLNKLYQKRLLDYENSNSSTENISIENCETNNPSNILFQTCNVSSFYEAMRSHFFKLNLKGRGQDFNDIFQYEDTNSPGCNLVVFSEVKAKNSIRSRVKFLDTNLNHYELPRQSAESLLKQLQKMSDKTSN